MWLGGHEPLAIPAISVKQDHPESLTVASSQATQKGHPRSASTQRSKTQRNFSLRAMICFTRADVSALSFRNEYEAFLKEMESAERVED